jgi:hypothetical protein
MEHQNDASEWSVRDVRNVLLDGKDARDVGGEDARANRLPPDGTYCPRFIRDVETRAQAMGHVIAEWADDQFDLSASALRNDPFAIDAAAEKARHVPATIKAELDRQITYETTQLLDCRARAEETATVYRRDLQKADATHPRRGWRGSAEFWLVLWTMLCVEGGLGAVMLWHALGPGRAVMTGMTLSAMSIAGGYLAARALLRPASRDLDTSARRLLQWILASTIGLATLFVMYVGACFRAAWIDGADGSPADIAAMFNNPAHVLINFDVLALIALGIIGFFVGALECWRFYNGYRPLLRESGLARTEADGVLRKAAEDLKSFADKTGTDGGAVLEDLEQKSAAWMRSVADHCDAANGIASEANRRDQLVCANVESIYAEYVEGFQEVRRFDRTAAFAFALGRNDTDVPELFVRARQAAMAGTSEVSKVLRQAQGQIAVHVEAAIVRIDELAGLRAVANSQALLPKGNNP